MACTGETSFDTAVNTLWTAAENAEFIDALVCTFANPFGGLAVFGTVVWFTVVSMSYIRTGSWAMPMVLTLLLGSAALQQMAQPVLGFASVLLAGGFAVVAVLIARRMDL